MSVKKDLSGVLSTEGNLIFPRLDYVGGKLEKETL